MGKRGCHGRAPQTIAGSSSTAFARTAVSGRLKRLLLRIRGPILPLGSERHGDDRRLIACAACGSRVVNPVAWHENGETQWWVRLRCGESAWTREVTITDDEAKQFDRDLDPGLLAIQSTVARLDRERMLSEMERFATALERDLIGPMDFKRDPPR
jgi:hypothetical protein